MSSEPIQIAAPFLGDEEWQALRGPLESGWLTQGPHVAEFERSFARRHGVSHGVAVTSCTTGLHLTLAALGIGPGDEVVVPAFTWVATANAVVYCGATPKFVDVDPQTFNLDLARLPDVLSPRTRAVVAVHLFGLCADTDAVKAMLPRGVALVEDAACAAGSALRGRPAGALGDAGVFSFHPRKIITTGEGGMVTTSDDALAEGLRSRRDHGASISDEMRHTGGEPWLLPDFDVLGFNYRMTDLQGALGQVQLTRLDALLAERRRWAEWYSKELAGISWLRMPSAPDGFDHSWQSYVTVVEPWAPKERNVVMKLLHEAGIATRPGTHAVPALGWYRSNFGTSADMFPVAVDLEARSMSIPLHNHMGEDDFGRVVDALGKI